LAAIVKAGSKLRKLLKSDRDWEWLKEFQFEVLTDDLDVAIPLAERAIYDLELKIEWGEDFLTDARDAIRKRSAFEWLAGAYLAQDYRICFGTEPTLQRNTHGQLSGPYILFVEQVLLEFRVRNGPRPFSREAIAKALTDVRKGKYRRAASSA